MKIDYDPEVDALYIRLLDGVHQCRNVRLSDEVTLNIGDNEVLVGIEILDAKEFLLQKESILPMVKLENVQYAIAA